MLSNKERENLRAGLNNAVDLISNIHRGITKLPATYQDIEDLKNYFSSLKNRVQELINDNTDNTDNTNNIRAYSDILEELQDLNSRLAPTIEVENETSNIPSQYTLPILGIVNVSTDNPDAKKDNIQQAIIIEAATFRLQRLQKVLTQLATHSLSIPKETPNLDVQLSEINKSIDEGIKLKEEIETMESHYTAGSAGSYVRKIVHFENVISQYSTYIPYTNTEAKNILLRAADLYNRHVNEISTLDIHSKKYYLLKDIEKLIEDFRTLYTKNEALAKRMNSPAGRELRSPPNAVELLLEIEVAVSEFETLENKEVLIANHASSRDDDDSVTSSASMSPPSTPSSDAPTDSSSAVNKQTVTFSYKSETQSATMTIKGSGAEKNPEIVQEIIVAPSEANGSVNQQIYAKLAKNDDGQEYAVEIYTMTKVKTPEDCLELAKATITAALELGIQQPLTIASGWAEYLRTAFMVCIQNKIEFTAPTEGILSLVSRGLAARDLKNMDAEKKNMYVISNKALPNADDNIKRCKEYTENDKAAKKKANPDPGIV